MNLTKQNVEQYLSTRKKAATTMATGVMFCVFSPVPLLILLSLARLNLIPMSLNVASTIGVIVLLIIVSISVGLFIYTGSILKAYEKLEYEDFNISDELADTVQTQKDNYKSTYTVMTIIATILCILSAIPIISGAFFSEIIREDAMIGLAALTLILVCIGVFLFVKCNTIMNSYDILLQTGDYTNKNKENRRLMNKYVTIYWLIVTLLYLGYSFITTNWDNSWIVWPIAGILYGILEKIVSLRNNDVASD